MVNLFDWIVVFVTLAEGSPNFSPLETWGVGGFRGQSVVCRTSPVALTPLFILTLLMLCDWRG